MKNIAMSVLIIALVGSTVMFAEAKAAITADAKDVDGYIDMPILLIEDEEKIAVQGTGNAGP